MSSISNKKREAFVEEVISLVRARYPLLYLSTYEEGRAMELLAEVGRSRGCRLFAWTRTQGVTEAGQPVGDVKDPAAILKWYEEQTEKSLLVLKDFHHYLKDPGVSRKLRDLAHALKRSPKTVVMLSPVVAVPPDLTKDVAVLDVPLPDRAEIEELVKRASGVLASDAGPSAGAIDSLVDAASGLTFDEIENALARSLVSKGKLDPRLISEEKRQIVRKSGILDFVETTGGTPDVGGMKQLRSWLGLRRRGFSPEARAARLPAPKGILLVGIPGCGKSLTAVTVGREWGLPLLRLDMGRVFSGLVGSSENNVRQAIATCEAVAPCILWVDEIEKGLSGTQSSGASDGGTTSRVFGTLLTWMQEKTSPVFVLATANDVSQLPPEFLRKGRFDEIFFVDLPTAPERREILDIQLKRFGWEIESLDAGMLIEKMSGFSGAEIEQVLVSARYAAFGRGGVLTQADMMEAAGETVPLSKTMADRIEALRSWARHRARPASKVEDQKLGDRFQLSQVGGQ